MADSVPIPEPPGLPFLGNLGEFTANPIEDIVRLSNTYGKMRLLYLYPSITLVSTCTFSYQHVSPIPAPPICCR